MELSHSRGATRGTDGALTSVDLGGAHRGVGVYNKAWLASCSPAGLSDLEVLMYSLTLTLSGMGLVS